MMVKIVKVIISVMLIIAAALLIVVLVVCYRFPQFMSYFESHCDFHYNYIGNDGERSGFGNSASGCGRDSMPTTCVSLEGETIPKTPVECNFLKSFFWLFDNNIK